MWKFNEVVRIEYRGDYKYFIVFDDGVSGVVDFREYLDYGPVFHALRDLSLFTKAKIEGGTISWPNSADIAPETLYEKTKRQAESTTSIFK